MKKRLEIFLLGGVTLKLDGQPLEKLSSQKAIALFIYLACNQRPFPRDVLADLFYGHLPQARARANLRVLLSRLRPLTGYLHISRQTIVFNSESNYWLDSIELETQLAAIVDEAAGGNALSPDTASRLEKAAALYRGDFLAGFYLDDALGFEEWAVVEQERLQRLVIEAMQSLTSYYLESGQYSPGVELAARLLQLDPLREEAHRQMMMMLAGSGQRSAALAQYERCVQRLDQELGAEPSQETSALFKRIRTLELEAQERAHQLTVAQPHNLPLQLTPFFGREVEIAQIIECANNKRCRLLTILGPGGAGKTRLALEAARLLLQMAGQAQFLVHGLFFIPLAPIVSAKFVAQAIAEALGFAFYGQDAQQDQLINHLRQKEMLLVLDNFEHLLNATDLLLDILKNASGVKIIVTSRERLNFRAEWLLPIEGLPYLEGEKAQYAPAVRLFAHSAERVSPHFSLDAEGEDALHICEKLGGLPLGIELAAASTRYHSCRQIAAHIKRNLDFLTTTMRDVPERHRSLRAVFEHSWALLTDEERDIFRKSSLFRGGFTLHAAKAATGASAAILDALADKSLLRRNALGRYHIHQMLRQYAAEKLAEAPEKEVATYNLHSAYYAGFLQEQASALKGQGQMAAVEEISAEIDNVRLAWHWILSRLEKGQNETGAMATIRKSAESLLLFYILRDWYQEGVEAFGRAAALLRKSDDPSATTGERGRLLALLLAYQGKLCEFTEHSNNARSLFEQSIAIFERLGNRRDKALPWQGLGYMAHIKGDYQQAKEYYRESLDIYQEIEDSWGIANVHSNLSLAARRQGAFLEAKQHARTSLSIRREIGDQRGVAASLNNLGLICCATGDYAQAKTALQEGLKISRHLNHKIGMANAYTGLCQAAFRLMEVAAAEQFGRQSLAVYEEIGDYWGVAIAFNNLGQMAMELGDYAKAKDLYREGIAIYRRIGIKSGLANTLGNLGEVCYKLGAFSEARQYLREGLQLAREIGATPIILDILMALAALLEEEGNKKQSLTLLAFIKSQPASLEAVREEAAALFAELAACCSPEVVAEAEARSRARELDAMIADVLVLLR